MKDCTQLVNQMVAEARRSIKKIQLNRTEVEETEDDNSAPSSDGAEPSKSQVETQLDESCNSGNMSLHLDETKHSSASSDESDA